MIEQSFLSHSYYKPAITRVETAPYIEPFNFTSIIKHNPNLTGKIKVKNKYYNILTPISIRIYQCEGFFFAENENLSIYGIGKNYQEAIEDFKMHLIYFFKYYKKLKKNELTGEAIRLKNLYKEIIKEE